jgi:hypothetical protein
MRGMWYPAGSASQYYSAHQPGDEGENFSASPYPSFIGDAARTRTLSAKGFGSSYAGETTKTGLPHRVFASPRPQSPIPSPQSPVPNPQSPIPNPQSPIPSPQSPIPNPQSPIPSPQSPIPNPQSPIPIPHSPFPTTFAILKAVTELTTEP